MPLKSIPIFPSAETFISVLFSHLDKRSYLIGISASGFHTDVHSFHLMFVKHRVRAHTRDLTPFFWASENTHKQLCVDFHTDVCTYRHQ